MSLQARYPLPLRRDLTDPRSSGAPAGAKSVLNDRRSTRRRA